jgi:hypothetical protein
MNKHNRRKSIKPTSRIHIISKGRPSLNLSPNLSLLQSLPDQSDDKLARIVAHHDDEVTEMSNAFSKSWSLLKNEGLARETQAYRREMADQRMEDQGFKPSAPLPRDAEAILRDLYYAGMILGAGGAGGAQGGQDHPMVEELAEEVMERYGWPEDDHPMQHREDELGNPISGPMMDR